MIVRWTSAARTNTCEIVAWNLHTGTDQGQHCLATNLLSHSLIYHTLFSCALGIFAVRTSVNYSKGTFSFSMKFIIPETQKENLTQLLKQTVISFEPIMAWHCCLRLYACRWLAVIWKVVWLGDDLRHGRTSRGEFWGKVDWHFCRHDRNGMDSGFRYIAKLRHK